ncbi:MAG: ribosome small subunit-dependent GTPase A [Planctomycetes bacterium]|nr:ribosome small subunit-dependent GTPase A [Planctomycetota bacterium]
MVTGRVVRIVANKFVVETPGGLVELSLTNKIRRSREGANKPAAVGDEVEFEPGTIGEGKLLRTLPRRTKLCRAKGATGQLEGVLVANADRLLAVFSSRAPDPDFRALDRALVMGESGRMECAIAINKIDLAPPPDVLQDYRRAGYRVFETCAITGKGLPEMRDWLAGRTTVLMGPSGVGKSSLLNAIEPSWNLKTGELSERIDEGKHTTTWVAMFALPGGGHVVDTPGIEVFGLWGVEIADLAAYFPEMREIAAGCKFGNCLHETEPGCAVKAEVQGGRIAGARYEGYLHILRELRGKASSV